MPSAWQDNHCSKIIKSLVRLETEYSPQRKQELNPGFAALKADTLTTGPSRRLSSGKVTSKQFLKDKPASQMDTNTSMDTQTASKGRWPQSNFWKTNQLPKWTPWPVWTHKLLPKVGDLKAISERQTSFPNGHHDQYGHTNCFQR